jgi:hypothetical protein
MASMFFHRQQIAAESYAVVTLGPDVWDMLIADASNGIELERYWMPNDRRSDFENRSRARRQQLQQQQQRQQQQPQPQGIQQQGPQAQGLHQQPQQGGQNANFGLQQQERQSQGRKEDEDLASQCGGDIKRGRVESIEQTFIVGPVYSSDSDDDESGINTVWRQYESLEGRVRRVFCGIWADDAESGADEVFCLVSEYSTGDMGVLGGGDNYRLSRQRLLYDSLRLAPSHLLLGAVVLDTSITTGVPVKSASDFAEDDSTACLVVETLQCLLVVPSGFEGSLFAGLEDARVSFDVLPLGAAVGVLGTRLRYPLSLVPGITDTVFMKRSSAEEGLLMLKAAHHLEGVAAVMKLVVSVSSIRQ